MSSWPLASYLRIASLAVVTCVGTVYASFAETSPPVQQHNSNAVWFENWQGLTNATMKVVAPNGEVISIFAESGTPVFRLQGGEVLDGVYRYELSAATRETEKIVNPINNGRGDAARDEVAVSYNTTGSFIVDRGVIITPEEIIEE